jgi:hypothetical protein
VDRHRSSLDEADHAQVRGPGVVEAVTSTSVQPHRHVYRWSDVKAERQTGVPPLCRSCGEAGDGVTTEAGHRVLAEWGAQFLNGLDRHAITDLVRSVEAEARFPLHDLDGHVECDPADCEVAAVRLALPSKAYAATITHGDIASALGLDRDRLADELEAEFRDEVGDMVHDLWLVSAEHILSGLRGDR